MQEGKQYVSSQAMVCVRSREEAEQVAAAYRATLLNYIDNGIALLELSDMIPTQQLMVMSTSEDLPLPALEPNRIKHYYTEPVTQSVPSDPSYSKQWFHKIMGDELAWDYTTGSGVTVAVIDSGCEATHSELAGQISASSAKFDNVGKRTYTGTAITDPEGHGTHVSGIIAAKRNNGNGGCGVAPDAKLVVCQMAGLSTDDGVSDEALIAAMYYVAGLPDVKIVNMSLGSHYSWGHSMAEKDAVTYLAAKKLVVVAAGNENYGRAGFPAAYPEVLAVSATTSSNRKASFSNYGPEVDIAAPGDGIYSSVPYNTYDIYDGTSMACPAVAGAAALVISRFHCTPAQARNYLLRSAKDLKNANYYGAGLVQTGQAVTGRNVTVKSGSAKGGTVSGGSFYEYGATPTFTATPYEGYTFVNWKKGSTVVSIDPIYNAYTVAADGASFTANFAALPKASITASVCSYSSNLISWKALPNASYYKVYRSATATGTFEDVSGEIAYSAAATVYTFEDAGRSFGVASFYKVEATFATGMTVSAVKSVKTNWPTMKIVKAEQAGPGANRVTWNAVPNVSGYTLTRTINRVTVPIEVALSSLTTSVDPKLGNLVTYEDKTSGITMNASASYKVQARVGEPGPAAVLSKVSASKTIKAGWGKVTVTAESCAYQGTTNDYPIMLTITPAPNATGHDVWWSLDKKTWNQFSISGSTYFINGVETGAPVYVQVRPYGQDTFGNRTEGSWSTLTARPVPEAPSNFYVDQYLASDDYGTLYYTHEGIWSKVKFANGYEVYRSTNLGKSFSRATNINQRDDGWFLSYMRVVTRDQIYAKMGYLYKVRAYVTYKGVKYYGPFSPIVVSGDVYNTLHSDWDLTSGMVKGRTDRLEAFISEQRKSLNFNQTRKIPDGKATRP